MSAVHVVALCPSLEEHSHTRTALERALSGAERAGASTDLIDFRALELVPYSQETDTDTETALELWNRLDPADGVLLGTPVFVHSYASALALAFEYLASDVLGGTTLGLLAVAEDPTVSPLPALCDLRAVGARFDAWVLPHQVEITYPPSAAFDDRGRIVDERLEERLSALGRGVVEHATTSTTASNDTTEHDR